MDACLEGGVDYLDTANYEPPAEAKLFYFWLWDYHDHFRDRSIMALLSSGSDPGVTNLFTAYAKKQHFDKLHELNIMECNAREHGHPFGTSFNPAINIREVSAQGKYWNCQR